MKIAIIGLGLVGGSMAKALTKHTDNRVFGMDTDAEILETAIEEGAIHAKLDREAFAETELLFLALYPKEAVSTFRSCASLLPKGALVLDLCGVKQAVFAPLLQTAKEHHLHYIGAHPMAGRELSGYAASDPELFRSAYMILTPPQDTPPQKLQIVEELCRSVGFRACTISSPEEHDRVIAFTSQLAHVVSCAYVLGPLAENFLGFSAGSFRDMTRVARLNETMWAQLFLDNSDALIEEIDGLISRLGEYAQLLRERDAQALRQKLKNAREKKEALEEMTKD